MKRIQLQLVDQNLEGVVKEMTQAVMENLENMPEEKAARAVAVNQSIRSVLEKYVHAYDLCGLAAGCHEAVEVDPWKLMDQDKD